MKLFALPKKDGSVVVRSCADGVDPAAENAKKHPSWLAQLSGEIIEIAEADLIAFGAADPQRKYRDAWKFEGGALVVDAAKKAEIDARPVPLTLEQRVAALERK